MRIQFKYPVKTAIRLREHWPITIGEFKLEWEMKNDEPVALILSRPFNDKDWLPSVRNGGADGLAAHIHMGHVDKHDEAERIIRSAQGLLSLFGNIDIDIDGFEQSWLPESDEERELIKINRFQKSVQRYDLWEPRHSSYDLIARALTVSKVAAQQEVTLAFLRRGRRDFHAGHFIQAYYNFFFFLETQYASGYSSPQKVTRALLAAAPINEALRRIRSGEEEVVKLSPQIVALLKLNNEKLIEHLVETRGNLHHHALRRPGVWHPDKPDAVETEADLLQLIVHSIALHEAIELIFSEEWAAQLMEDAKAAGAIVKVKAMGYGWKNGQRIPLTRLIFSVPGQIIDQAKIHHIHSRLRSENRFNIRGIELAEYVLCSEDERETYAIWRRVDAAPADSKSF